MSRNLVSVRIPLFITESIETFRFDSEYDFDNESTTKFLTGARKIVVGSSLVTGLLFTMRISEAIVVKISS